MLNPKFLPRLPEIFRKLISKLLKQLAYNFTEYVSEDREKHKKKYLIKFFISILPQISLQYHFTSVLNPTLMMLSFYPKQQLTTADICLHFSSHSHFITTTHVTTPFAKEDLKRASFAEIVYASK